METIFYLVNNEPAPDGRSALKYIEFYVVIHSLVILFFCYFIGFFVLTWYSSLNSDSCSVLPILF